MKLTHDQKEQIIAGIRLMGTKKAGALVANIQNIFSNLSQNPLTNILK